MRIMFFRYISKISTSFEVSNIDALLNSFRLVYFVLKGADNTPNMKRSFFPV